MDDKELLGIYTGYLISWFGLTTGTGLPHLLHGAISHDRDQQFLAGPSRNGKDLWQVVKPYVRQVKQNQIPFRYVLNDVRFVSAGKRKVRASIAKRPQIVGLPPGDTHCCNNSEPDVFRTAVRIALDCYFMPVPG
jgi:hypothetical protein